METLTLIGLAIAPALAIILFVYSRDKYEKEPRWVLFWAFVLGMISIIPAAFFESCFSSDFLNPVDTFIYAVFVVGLAEEGSKFFFLRIHAYRKKAFNEPFDGIMYAVMVSMGFATFENVLYVLSGGIEVAWLRMFTAVPAHAAFGIIMGYYAGKAKFGKNKFGTLLWGVFLAMLIHGLYDFFLFQQNWPGLSILAFVVLLIGIRLSFVAMRKSRENSPFRPFTPKYPEGNKPDRT
ncbi:MAG: PrsW family intramembrane metalloprotease [Bacteroidetes bacterium]|nr:PrsW family intramembrane metalloprotease [Bacteroidota bacterium]MBU1718397.1 PrsW family intramembrane metalloprotease [Bacteroidota bacterium]